MPSGLQRNGQWLCKPCKMLFRSREALMEHKQQMRLSGAPRHIHCRHCGQDFKTELAETCHVQQFHPQDQNLECPGCGFGPFARASGLVSHIEQGLCSRLSVTDLEARREKKTAFARKLEALTHEPVKNNFAKYICPRAPATGSWDEPDARAAVVHSGPENLSPRRDDAWDEWCGRDGVADWNTKTDPAAADWGNSKSSSGDSVTERVGHWNTEAAEQPPFDSSHPDHPDNALFDTKQYWCIFSKRFICPQPFCGKAFKKATGLVGHLRSSAHGNKRYTCPACHRVFKSLMAITSHAEQGGSRCHARDAPDYAAFIDQLTAGLVDVSVDRHHDGTVKYETSKEALRELGGTRAGKTADAKLWW